MTAKVKGLFILDRHELDKIYGPKALEEIGVLADIYAPPQTADSIKHEPALLKDAEVVFSGWGAPLMDADFLAAAPNLKAVFYGAGSLRGMVTDAFWDRDIIATSSYAANAIPVAEYCVAQIIFALKQGWRHVANVKAKKNWSNFPMIGAYDSQVGLVSFGQVARKARELLRSYDMAISVYCPILTSEQANSWEVKLCGLEEVFATSHVVSLHTPELSGTTGLIRGHHFESMRQDATFINTARGAVVNEAEMVAVLQKRSDLTAVLDVTSPEPPMPDSPLYQLDNVILTPHIAGAVDGECRRLGRYALDEFKRYLKREPLLWQITREVATTMA
jgi:phosphoglycerate dehydrogenase-like enzyme